MKQNAPDTTHVKTIGIFYAQEFTNKCCKDKPIILEAMVEDDGIHGYICECKCGTWNTTGHCSPAEAIMEYEMMCREYPDEIEVNDPDLIEKYLAYHED